MASGKHYCISLTKAPLNVKIGVMVNLNNQHCDKIIIIIDFTIQETKGSVTEMKRNESNACIEGLLKTLTTRLTY